MSLWTCPTHGLHGPCPGNVCPTCGAAMRWTTTQGSGTAELPALAISTRLVSPVSGDVNGPQQGANAAEQVSGTPTLTGPSATRTPAYRAIIEAVAQAAAAEGAEVRPAASGEASPTRGNIWPSLVLEIRESEMFAGIAHVLILDCAHRGVRARGTYRVGDLLWCGYCAS